jgi:recombination protein RecA
LVARRIPASTASAPARERYFPREDIEFIPSGCTVLDCVLGGGWPLGRIANIVGDKAVGKTLLAIEACANFAQKYPRGHIWYREAEAAFDVSYASELGLPADRVDFGPEGTDSSWDTVEDIAEDLERCAAAALKSGQPGIYIIDSLDAISSRAEMGRKAGEGTFGLEKPKQLGQLFRKQVRALKAARIVLLVVSQIRDKIGITFGDKHTRTGGKALDFYASQILWLHHKGMLKSTSRGVERTTAVRIRAKCKKNKMAPSFRECEFVLRFGYGTDDFEAACAYLHEVGMLGRMTGLKIVKGEKEQAREVGNFLRQLTKLEGAELRAKQAEISALVRATWCEVEDRFRPIQRKYG